jgi:tetratricopeptide (TPR) repeat protein
MTPGLFVLNRDKWGFHPEYREYEIIIRHFRAMVFSPSFVLRLSVFMQLSMDIPGWPFALWSRWRGDKARSRRDWAEARRHYERYLARSPKDGAVWIQLGHACKEAGDFDTAERAYRRASDFGSSRGDAFLHLGRLPRIRGKASRPVANQSLTRADADSILERLGQLERQNTLLLRQMVPEEIHWRHPMSPHAPTQPGTMVFDKSVLCREANFREPYFAYWTKTLGARFGYRRKLWEYVFICQALFERGLLASGSRGLGFGVGGEPFSAYFASQGCWILATDMAVDSAVVAGWTELAEHAAGKEALRCPQLCADAIFERNVDFRVVDMNAVPNDLAGFDFCWSACALEHLGSIEQGLRFIERSLEPLKPGGYAVHTTEFNLSSNDDTLKDGRTVLFRRRDFEALTQKLQAAGHEVAPFDFDPGWGKVDRYIDVPPYLEEPHLKLALEGYATTSIGLIVRKKP